MRKYIFTIALLLAIPAQQSNAEWKFGVAVGLTDIGYDLTYTRADSASDISTSGDASADDPTLNTELFDTSYDATEITFDMRNGKHAFAYKTTDGSVDSFFDDRTPAWDASNYNLGATNAVDREEWTLSYAYSINANWTASMGIYEGTLDVGYTRGFSDTYNVGTIDEYSWTSSNNGFQEFTSDGAFIAIAYQNRITDKLFWFAKLGFQTNDFEMKDSFTRSSAFQAVDPAFQEIVVGYFEETYGFSNGQYGYSIVDRIETEGDSTVYGIGFVYAINPKNTIALEFETKTYSYDPADGGQESCSGFAYICDQDPYTFASSVDEEASYVTLRYRYAF